MTQEQLMMQPPHGARRALGDNGVAAPQAPLNPQAATTPLANAPVPTQTAPATAPWAAPAASPVLDPATAEQLRVAVQYGAPDEEIIQYLAAAGVTLLHIAAAREAATFGVLEAASGAVPASPAPGPDPHAPQTGREIWWTVGYQVAQIPSQEIVNTLAQRGLMLRPDASRPNGGYVCAACPPQPNASPVSPDAAPSAEEPPAAAPEPAEAQRQRWNKARDEPEVLRLLADGKSPREIAEAIGLSLKSTERNIKKLIKEHPHLSMGRNNPPETAASKAAQAGWVQVGVRVEGTADTAPPPDITAIVLAKGLALEWRGDAYYVVDPKGASIAPAPPLNPDQPPEGELAPLTSAMLVHKETLGPPITESFLPEAHVTPPTEPLNRALVVLAKVQAFVIANDLDFAEICAAAKLLDASLDAGG